VLPHAFSYLGIINFHSETLFISEMLEKETNPKQLHSSSLEEQIMQPITLM